MGELTASDVEVFTAGRLPADSPAVAGMLSAALGAARREAGWHVSPVHTDTVTLTSRRRHILELPTLRVVELTAVTEAGEPVDVHAVNCSAGRPPGGLGGQVTLRKPRYMCWRGNVTVTMDHGYTEDEAADWRHAVLTIVDQMSTLPVAATTGRSDADLTSKGIDDVSYGWNSVAAAMNTDLFYSAKAIIDAYKLPGIYHA